MSRRCLRRPSIMRERDRRTLIRTMNRGKSHSSTSAESPTNTGAKAGGSYSRLNHLTNTQSLAEMLKTTMTVTMRLRFGTERGENIAESYLSFMDSYKQAFIHVL
ncbi:50S ribosomal protein [Actinidia chinensis var. chinensis]|uniref:50S ribosomal protein n=1 Tax=Actinidia chinensis var. chinensis TaxID=1590841 RepID=A0A2R6RYK7_ACTCC|nr:50S ribosomal protein [Actinidia chinensis var. chinensis]